MSAKTGVHVWTLQKKLQDFMSADNGIKFLSQVFPIADFEWQIIAYPNGNRFENYGSVMVYLKLIKYPSDLPYGGVVTVNFRIQCVETCSSNTYIETYARANDSKGWSSKNLLLSDLAKESITKVTFQIDVKILKIVDSNQRNTYEAPLKIFKNKFALKWVVPDEIANRFQYANNGKWFESGNYSNLWCFKCAPNGYNEKNVGSALLFVQLCALPPNISKLKCKVKLYHVESGTKWTVKKGFSYDTKNAGWTKAKLSYEKLMKYDTITFRAEIEILSIVDLDGNKSSMKDSAKIAHDDGNIGIKNQNLKIKNRGRRSKTATARPGANPYGGYGSHNYQHYFNDGYKKSQQNNATQLAQQKQESKDSNENESSEESESEHREFFRQPSDEYETCSESELELNSLGDIQSQITFLSKEYKKLKKAITGLKERSDSNDRVIGQLQSEVRLLKGSKGKKIKPFVPSEIMTANDKSKHSNVGSGSGSGDLLDVFGNFTNPIPTTGATPVNGVFSPGINTPGADTFDTGKYQGSTGTANANEKKGAIGGWTTF